MTITLSEFPLLSKPITVTEHVYSPISWPSNGENVTVLENFNLCSDLVFVWLKIITRGDSDNDVFPLHSILTRGGDTPTTTIAVQTSVWGSPIIDPSTDCDMSIGILGTSK